MSTQSLKECYIIKFKLGSEEYGLPSESIAEVIRVPEINKLPNTEDYLLGVIKVKGTIIPIIDLKKKLTGDYTHLKEDCRIVVMEINYSEVGLLVESLDSNLSCEYTEMETGEDIYSEIPENYLLGIAHNENSAVRILNEQAILG